MSLKKRMDEDLKKAMKSRDSIAMRTLRLLKTAITHREIEVGAELEESEVLRIIEKQLRQRRESAVQYNQAGRSELALEEEKEAVFLEGYLPARWSLDEIEKCVDIAIAQVGAHSLKDMGAVMKTVLAKSQGRAENKVLSDIVKRKLSTN